MKIRTVFICVTLFTIQTFFVFAGDYNPKDIKSWWLYESEDGINPYTNMINKEVVVKLKPERLINIDMVPDDFLKGKYTLIDIWATWCSPCLAAIPENNAIFLKYKNKLNVIGICTAKDSDGFEDVVKSKGIIYPVGVDTSGEISKYFKAKLYPTYHLIDPDGKLVVADIKAEYLHNVLNTVLNN
ncbi:MAG: TlpA family protein disulfide reductase [Candidatus Anammoxibacter sp.]